MAVKTFTTGEVLTASDTNTYLNNGGFVYVANTTFSANTSKDIDSCFTTTYNHYLIQGSFTTSADATLYYLLRDGTTTNTGTNVDNVEYYQSWGAATVTGQFASAQTGSRCGYVDSVYGGAFSLWLYNPQLSAYTFGEYTGTGGDYGVRGNSRHTVNTTYEGIRITTSAGTATLTGTVTVYGARLG
jgi:hypothetical protein